MTPVSSTIPFHCLVLGFMLVFVCQARTDDTLNDPYAAKRGAMVQNQIASPPGGRIPVRDEVVLDAMRSVLRHRFVPPAQQRNAYRDRPLPIGHGQTISQPYIVAYMTAILDPEPTDTVLEIGTGSGYQAAILATIVKKVYTLEIVEPLFEEATTRLKAEGLENVHTRHGDGYFGWKEKGPFDAIIVTAAASHIPPPLIEQLKPGGKMVIPVGPVFQVQSLMLLEKQEDGTIRQQQIMRVQFVPLTRTKTAGPEAPPKR